MPRNPQRYPLAWPHGWPRSDKMRSSPWRQRGGDLTISTAVQRLENQLRLLGAEDAALSSNLKLGVSGVPLSGQAEPADRGVAIYFVLEGKDRVLACDKYLSAAGNMVAIANHIDALRRIDRYGVGSIAQAFAGYAALDPPNEDNRPAWRKILHFKPMIQVTAADVQVNYRLLARAAATDEGRLLELNLAREQALAELGN